MALLEPNWRPDRRQLRGFGLLWLAFFGALALHRAWVAGAFVSGTPAGLTGPWLVPFVLGLVALAGGALGLAAPGALRPVYVAWLALAFPIGWVISHLVLGLIYFGLFTGIALLFRLMRRDGLSRAFDRRATTYWVPRPPAPQVDRYFRQF